MPAYLKKNGPAILREALKKITTQTPITSVSAGSIARALTEAGTTEIGDLYDIMDYNMNQNLLSTASGSALDLLGSLYNVQRKTLNSAATVDKSVGAFYFALANPLPYNLLIPAGTNVYTDGISYIGRQFSFSTTSDVNIPAGTLRVYASIKANFTDTVYTAGVNTLKVNDFIPPAGVVVLSNNPKEITQLSGYEADDIFRTRIIKSLRTASAGTVDAVRYQALNVAGVRDVTIRQAPYGMGSFEVIIIPEQNNNTAQVVANATAAMNAVKPLGSRMITKTPVLVPLNLSVDLILPGAGSTQITDLAIKRASVAVLTYLNTLLPGNPLVYNRLVSLMINSSESVKDVVIKTLAVNGVEVMRRNYQPADDVQLIPGSITISVATA